MMWVDEWSSVAEGAPDERKSAGNSVLWLRLSEDSKKQIMVLVPPAQRLAVQNVGTSSCHVKPFPAESLRQIVTELMLQRKRICIVTAESRKNV
jgi:hypothetical protein